MCAFVLVKSTLWGTPSSTFASPFSNTSRSSRRRPGSCRPPTAVAQPDVVIIGAGIAGLSTAFELAQNGASVRILTSPNRRPAALAAAGMLAPNAEALPTVMHNLATQSLNLYPDFINNLQAVVPGIDVGFQARNDFLVPILDQMNAPTFPPGARYEWVSGNALQMLEPALADSVSSAARMVDDRSVDARKVYAALEAACIKLGVRINETPVRRIIAGLGTGVVDAVYTADNEIVRAGHYVVASGAWSHSVLPSVPVRPVKGQMLSLRPPTHDDGSNRLQHVLCSSKCYVVPKEESQLFYIGATVEESGFTTHITAGGILDLLHSAIELVPAFSDYEIAETWTGLRPTTPDLAPILGLSEFSNVSVASGFHRNGILLAPITGKLTAAVAMGKSASLSEEMQQFLDGFSYRRFFSGALHESELSTSSTSVQKPSTTSPTEESSVEAPLPSPESSERTSPGVGSDDEEKPQVMMYRILEDGTNEPVLPPKNWQPSSAIASEQNQKSSDIPFSSSSDESNSPNTVENGVEILATKQMSVTYEQDLTQSPPGQKPSQPVPTDTVNNVEEASYTLNVANPENISGINDAYQDVLKNRGREDINKKSRAANRAFGRQKSSLEDDDSVPLSLTEEEVSLFDKAVEAGLKEMEEFAKCFDSNDPSVVATNKDKEQMAVAQASGLGDGNEPKDGYF